MPQKDILVLNIRSKPKKGKRVLVCVCVCVCLSVLSVCTHISDKLGNKCLIVVYAGCQNHACDALPVVACQWDHASDDKAVISCLQRVRTDSGCHACQGMLVMLACLWCHACNATPDIQKKNWRAPRYRLVQYKNLIECWGSSLFGQMHPTVNKTILPNMHLHKRTVHLNLLIFTRHYHTQIW